MKPRKNRCPVISYGINTGGWRTRKLSKSMIAVLEPDVGYGCEPWRRNRKALIDPDVR